MNNFKLCQSIIAIQNRKILDRKVMLLIVICFLSLPVYAKDNSPICFQEMLVNLRCVVTLVNGNNVYHPEGNMTGVRVGEKGVVLCPSFIQKAKPTIVGNGKISFIRYYATYENLTKEAKVLYSGPEFCLLDFGPEFSGRYLTPDLITQPTVDTDHVILIKASQASSQSAIVHVCFNPASQMDELKPIISGCTLTRDWLGALCISTDKKTVLGILSAFSSSNQNNSIYNFNLNSVPMPLIPDGIITPINIKDFKLLLQDHQIIELSRLEWMGIKYKSVRKPQNTSCPYYLQILSIKPHSLGERYGLQIGDKIIKVNNKAIITEKEGRAIFFDMNDIMKHEPICLTFLRGDREEKCFFKIPEPKNLSPVPINCIGVTVELAHPPKGYMCEFRILDMKQTTKSYVPHLRVGDIIQRVNQKQFKHYNELERYLDSAQGELIFELLRDKQKLIIIGEKS